ncbi:hypothetical protein EJ05DRAFT_501804 [Pseudovirgaria hyperparasitica]|uniref:Glycosyltransferase family 25 protein n=1 Tax=Pseudovirgaria hyperparasitica TaxID=470096 RepID=A0A6A6W198_9PEZI|nr:uncharacterized protein EJ05DRAFT_501804 [Pseudovirgaria hyperparasitica]KAF2756305.1 hypothetical protein EJ05DRAFT_501804 [Pseudovirgaria hyperparasitica]
MSPKGGMLLFLQHRLYIAVAVAACLILYVSNVLFFRGLALAPRHLQKADRVKHPANETLGFGAIIAVGRNNSTRRDDLVYAANITSLSIDFPSQPKWTEESISNFRDPQDPDGKNITRGAIYAWMGHLNALRWFLAHPELETAFIIEDDVDWDVALRTTQIPLTSRAFAHFMGTADPTSPSLFHSRLADHYWSDLNKWDVLWLGHCGDFFGIQEQEGMRRTVFEDPTMPEHESLDFYLQMHFNTVNFPKPKKRMIHETRLSLCTFGYGVTRASAQMMLKRYSQQHPSLVTWAWDVMVRLACTKEGFRCFTVNPELMRHIEGPSAVSLEDHKEEKAKSNITPNLRCAARRSEWRTWHWGLWEWAKHRIELRGDKECLADLLGAGDVKWPSPKEIGDENWQGTKEVS